MKLALHKTDENQLVGMAALNGGLVLTTPAASINIEAASR